MCCVTVEGIYWRLENGAELKNKHAYVILFHLIIYRLDIFSSTSFTLQILFF